LNPPSRIVPQAHSGTAGVPMLSSTACALVADSKRRRASGERPHLAARSSLTGLSVPFWEVREPFREVRPIAPAGR
jgi:hypothetical protein